MRAGRVKAVLRYVALDHPLQQVDETLLQEMRRAQDNVLSNCFKNSAELVSKVLDDAKVTCAVPERLEDEPLSAVARLPHAKLCAFWGSLLRDSGVSESALPHHIINLAQQTQF